MIEKANNNPSSLEYSTGIERSLIGYCWPWTVRPGESLDFMVSTYDECEQGQEPKPYQADLVRVLCGDVANQKSDVKIREIEAAFNGQYEGRHQASYPGSYIEVGDAPALNSLKSFTVQTYLWPSIVGRSAGLVLPGFIAEGEGDAEDHDQTLVSRFDNTRQCGWSLFIDINGKLAFKVGSGDGGTHTVHLSQPLIANRWFLVSAQYNAEDGSLMVAAEPVKCVSTKESAWSAEAEIIKLPPAIEVPQQGPLRFGAATGGKGNGQRLRPVDVLNGKLDSIRLSHGLLDRTKRQALAQLRPSQHLMSQTVGCWDFAAGIGTTRVHELSDQSLHGTAVNMPDRAVVGVYWDRSMGQNWRYAKDGYSACHFHDDDLYDCEWRADFSYQVPENLPSGVYAARLRHGDFEDHIAFFVAPKKNQTAAKAALLISTTGYTAYTNFDGFHNRYRQRETKKADGNTDITKEKLFPYLVTKKEDGEFMTRHPELGKGTYRFHVDGSPCRHSSQKHPNLMMQVQGGYSKLAADLYIVDLIQASGLDVDTITDDLLHAEGIDLLKDYRVVMTGHHPEYLSHASLDAIERYIDEGGRWMYLGGNGYFWVSPYHAELPGALEVRRRAPELWGREYWSQSEMVSEFEGSDSGLTSDAGRPAYPLVGVGMVGNLHSLGAPYYRKPDADDARARFIFEGVSDQVLGDFGLYPGGAAGFEVDAYRPECGSPAHALVLASSGQFEYPFLMPDGTAAEEYRINYPMPQSDVVFFETPAGGAVFSVGSMAWTFSLNHNHHDNNIAKITLNVLQRFLDSRPFVMPGNGKSTAEIGITNPKFVEGISCD